MNARSTSRVLITGAAGTIGLVLRERLRGRYPLLRLADLMPQAAAQSGEEVITCDVRDVGTLHRALQGIDCVVHLAGIPNEDSWEAIRSTNIDGTYALFEAARLQQVRRVVFASSNHVVGFHRRAHVLDEDSTLRPDSRYGVSKVFGEALGRLYADKYGMSVACLRIGTFRTPDRPTQVRHLATWVSHRDTTELVRACIEHPAFHYVTAYGVSANTRSVWVNREAQFLGFVPKDNAEIYAEELLRADAQEDALEALFHGGSYCAAEYAGDRSQVT